MQQSIGLRAGILVLALAGLLTYVVSAATTYTDPDGRFGFTAPDGYIQRYRAGTDISYRSATTQTSTVDITVIAEAPDPIPVADTLAMNAVKGLVPPTYTLGAAGIQPTLLDGQPARRFDYYTTLDGVPTRTHTLQIVATTAKAAYLLVFSATDTDYSKMLSDTAIIPGSFSFGDAIGAGSVTTGSSSATTDGSGTTASIATGATSATTPVPTAAPAFPTASNSAPVMGPAIPPDLAPPLPIVTLVPGASSVLANATPTPAIAGSFGSAPTATAGAANTVTGKEPGYGSGFPSRGVLTTRDPSTDRN